MSLIKSDYVFHPPSGSSVPGKEDANPYMNYPPDDLKNLLVTIENAHEIELIKRALKQWERIFQDTGYPYKRLASRLRFIADRMLKAEIVGPAQNLDYYQDMEIPEGYESVLEGLKNYHDDEDYTRFDYNRQGERPLVEMDFLEGDFATPKDRVFEQGTVTPRGDGPDPEGMDGPSIGGPIDAWPDMI